MKQTRAFDIRQSIRDGLPKTIESGSWNELTFKVFAERAIEIETELAGRKDAVDLPPPNIAQHHTFNQKVMEQARTRALEIMALIDA